MSRPASLIGTQSSDHAEGNSILSGTDMWIRGVYAYTTRAHLSCSAAASEEQLSKLRWLGADRNGIVAG